MTTKNDKNRHGLGMIILNDIAKKYESKFITENDEKSFTSLIVLKLN